MVKNIVFSARLGSPPDKFTNESKNGRIRHKTKELGESALAKAVKQTIEEQQDAEIILALFGASERYNFASNSNNLNYLWISGGP